MLLLEHGANLESKNRENDTPLFRAVEWKNIEMVKLLVSLNVNIEARYIYGNTALLKAAYQGDLEIVKFLISKQANINSVDDSGNTALICAAEAGHVDVAKEFLEHDVDVHAKNKAGKTALDRAKTEEIKKLIEDYIKAKAEESRLLASAVISSPEVDQSPQSSTAIVKESFFSSVVSFSNNVFKDMIYTLTDGVRGNDGQAPSSKNPKQSDDQQQKK